MIWRRRMERELDREIAEYLALETEENISRGMPPQEARSAALRKFGNITRVKEDTRSVWVWSWLDTLGGDVRQAFRRVRRGPGTAALVVLSLALAFIPSITVFVVLDRLFLTRLPVRAPDEVFQIRFRDVRPNATYRYLPASYRDFEDFRRSLTSVAGLAYERPQNVMAVLNGRVAIVPALLVNDDYFDVLGLPVNRGRGLAESRSLILSYSLWKREFGGRPDVVGQTLLLNGQAFTIGGVAGPELQPLGGIVPIELWIPIETWLDLWPRLRGSIGSRDDLVGNLWGRIRPGVPIARAAAEVESVSRDLPEKWPGAKRDLVGCTYDVLRDRARGGRNITGIGVLVLWILLAVACANVAGVLLARAEERRHETSIRQALGASRFRLIRAWMVESIVLASVAAGLGLTGARVLIDLLPGWLPSLPIPLHFGFSLGPRVWIYATVMVGVAALSFGLIPAWRGSRPDLLTGLRHDSTVSVFHARIPVRSLLIVAQVAAAEVLLFGAGLVLDTLRTVRRLDPGLDPNRPVAMAMVIATAEDGSQRPIDCDAVAARLAQIGGVRRVAYGHTVPLAGYGGGGTLRLEPPGHEPREVFGGSAGPGFLSLLGVRMLAGRDLERFDRQSVVVNMALARLLDPAGRVVGRPVRLSGRMMQVVGVFQDAGWNSVRETAQPRAITLGPALAGEITFAVEVAGNPRDYLARLRTAIAAAQPGATVTTLKTLSQHYEDALYLERTATRMLYGLGLAALLLTATGLHGITRALFARRTREFAIRLAIGAAPRQMIGEVLSNGLILTGIGLVLGLAVALPVALIVGAKVHGFSPWSVTALGFSLAIVIGTATIAAGQPAFRVLRIQPAEVLRAE